MHDSSMIFHIRNSCYKQEVEYVRQHFQHHYQNDILLDAYKSKWWLCKRITDEIHVSLKYIQVYMDRVKHGSFC